VIEQLDHRKRFVQALAASESKRDARCDARCDRKASVMREAQFEKQAECAMRDAS